MTSTERSSEILDSQQCDVPVPAIAWAKVLESRGVEGSWFVAFCHYAECCEGLPCDDEAYRATLEAREFFASGLTLLRQKRNWRQRENGWVEIQDDAGGWFFPDCACRCSWCSNCLGCIRKMFDGDRFEDEDGKCKESSDGNHWVISTKNGGE